jgi:DNA polymerase-1
VNPDISRPLVRGLEMRDHPGVLVDASMHNRQRAELPATMARPEPAAYAAAGGPFNLGSPKQLQEVLYERLALPILGKTPKGQPSTAEDVLQELAASFELPRLVLEYRALAKLKSTYTDKLPLEIEPRTGRIHTSYHQAVAATGRLSSSDPNLQNIPIRTPEGRRIRQAFVAPPGYVLLAADYSQIELRIMAHLSGDLGLLEAFANDQDIHRTTASEVFNTPVEEVTADQRRSAKAINFGLIYGMSAFGLAKQLGIERGEAQTYVNLYFERYPGVKRYMDETRRIAREQGYVTTVFGRRLHLPEINSRNGQRRQYAERCVSIEVPEQAYLNNLGDGWKCGRGYHVAVASCVAINVPANGYLTNASYGSGWACDRGYRAVGATCAAVVVPANGYFVDASYGPGWECKRGFSDDGGTCVAVQLPANAHLDHTGRAWNCDEPFLRELDRCVSPARR